MMVFHGGAGLSWLRTTTSQPSTGVVLSEPGMLPSRFELSIDLASVHTPIWHLGTGLQCVNAFHIDIGFIACLESMSKSNT